MARKTIFIAVILALLATSFASCGLLPSVSTPVPTPTPVPTIGPPPTVFHPSPTPAPTLIPLNYYSFGSTVTSSPWQIVAGQPQWATTFSGPGPQSPPTGSIFLLVPVTVWNVGITPFQVAASDFQLISAVGAIYGAKPPPATIVYSSLSIRSPFPYYTYTVQPSGLVTGVIIYTPPIAATDLSIRILVNGQYLVWNVPSHT
jgi:hypothetical protein